MIGQTISHYRIVEKIGRGGMGAVYKAEDTRLDRKVAIKLLGSALSTDPEAKRRFLQEAKHASSLDHSGIGVIHEIDEDPEAGLFIVMNLYGGGSFKDLVREAPVDPQKVLLLIREVATGLAHAHDNGMIHRDIKPANILLTEDGQAKIVDFGLARYVDQTRMTRTEVALGTPAYMSPEQAQAKELDPRTDLFSLGIVLYELLTGRLPFPGENSNVILFGIVSGEYTPLTDHRPELPQELQEIVDGLLAKNPDDRIQSARELKQVLDRLLGLSTEETSMLSTAKSGWTAAARRRRRRRALLPLGLILVALLGVLVLRLVPFGSISPEAQGSEYSVAIMEFQDLITPDDPAVAAGLTGLLHVGLVEASPVRVVSPDYLFDIRRRLFGVARGQIGGDQALQVARESGASFLISGQILGVDGERMLAWRLVDTADGASRAARHVRFSEISSAADSVINEVLPLLASVAHAAPLRSLQPVERLTTESSSAYQHYMTGLMDLESGSTTSAIVSLQRAVNADSGFALAHFALSRAHHSSTTAASDAVMEHAERAWELRTALGFKDRLRLQAWLETLRFEIPAAIVTYEELLVRWPDDRAVLTGMASITNNWWYAEEAIRVARQGLELYPDDLILGYLLQATLAYSGHPEEALEVALDYTDRHRDEFRAWFALGNRYLEMGRTDEAEAAWREALVRDPESRRAERALAYCHYSRGNVDATITALMEIFRRPGLSPGERFSILHSDFGPGLALLPAELGRYSESMDLVEDFMAASTDSTVADLIDARLYWLYLGVGQAERAEALARGWVARSRERGGPMARMDLARTLIFQDRLEEARQAAGDLANREGNWAAITKMAARQISAELDLAAGHHDAAIAKLEGMFANGVPRYGRFGLFLQELLARAYREGGRHEEAVAALNTLLRSFGGHAVAHYELGLNHEAMGDETAAISAYEQFLADWSRADSGLPQPADARARLAHLQASL